MVYQVKRSTIHEAPLGSDLNPKRAVSSVNHLTDGPKSAPRWHSEGTWQHEMPTKNQCIGEKNRIYPVDRFLTPWRLDGSTRPGY
jgi:hypothetical protein